MKTIQHSNTRKVPKSTYSIYFTNITKIRYRSFREITKIIKKRIKPRCHDCNLRGEI